MQRILTTVITALALASPVGLLGCPEQDDGPMEKAGESIDEAAEEAEEGLEEAGDEIEESVE